MSEKTDRRCFLARGVLGAAAVGAAHVSIEENILAAAIDDGSATAEVQAKPRTDVVPGSMPLGRIGNVSMSRLIIGGNLIGGWAHSRDLMYASKLFTSYNTEAKIFETLELAQACGINTIQLDPKCWDTVAKYNRNRQTKIQTVVCIGLNQDAAREKISLEQWVDMGATMLYTHGGVTDRHMMNGGKIEEIGETVAKIKSLGRAGRRRRSFAEHAHGLRGEQRRRGLLRQNLPHGPATGRPRPRRAARNTTGCEPTPPTTTQTTTPCGATTPRRRRPSWRRSTSPWIAFKVMAAGAIKPQFAFQYAFRHGADFVLAGMFDFQVEDDVKIALAAIKKSSDRRRPWCA